MEKRMQFQDNPSRFYLLIARIIGFFITGIFILFMVPEFISLLNENTHSETWLFFYALALTYGLGFLVTFWKVGLGGLLLVICSIFITLAFIDSKSREVFLLFIPPLFFRNLVFDLQETFKTEAFLN